MKRYLVSITVLISIVSARSGATTCSDMDTRDPKSIEYLTDVYNSNQAIGIFEVTEIGPFLDAPIAGLVTAGIKLKSVRMIKGEIGREHIHQFVSTRKRVPYTVKRQYLMALKVGPDKNGSTDGGCDRTFQVDLKDADFYIKKFESFKKLEEKKAKASNRH